MEPRYRVEERRHTDEGDDVVQVIDRVFGRPLSQTAAEAVRAWAMAKEPHAYEPHTDRRLVVLGPDSTLGGGS